VRRSAGNPKRRLMQRPTAQALGLTVALAGLGTAAIVRGGPWPDHVVGTRVEVTWWMLLIAFAVTELLVFHIEMHREAHTFSFSELAFVVGLCFASPMALLAGRLVGGTLVLAWRRQAPVKLVFNMAVFVAEVGTALFVFHGIANHAPVDSVQVWGGALVAVLAADVMSAFAVGLVIKWHGGASDFRVLVGIAALTATFNVCLGVVTALIQIGRAHV